MKHVHRVIITTFSIATLLALMTLSTQAQAHVPLEPGKPLADVIAAGQTHTYRITLAAGQFMRIVVEQTGCDVALTLVAPDGQTAVERKLNRPNGLESLSYEAPTSGAYRLQLHPFKLTDNYPNPGAYQVQVSDFTGAYRLRLETHAAATAQDRQRSEAERLLAEAYRMGKQMGAMPQQKEAKAQQALALFRTLGDQYWEATTLGLIATAHFAASSYDKAVDGYSQALAIWRAAGDQINEARTLNDLGRAYQQDKNLPKATEGYEQARRLARESNGRTTEAQALNNLAGVTETQSRRDRVQAIEYINQALPLIREVADRQCEATLLFRLAQNYAYSYDDRDYEKKATESYQQAVALTQQINERGLESRILLDAGWYYFRHSHYERGQEYAERALAIRREKNDKSGEAAALLLLGSLSGAQGQYEKAVTHFLRGLALNRELKLKNGEALILGNLGYTYFLLGQYEKSLGYYQSALTLFREINARSFEGLQLSNIGEVYLKLGQLAEARKYLEQATIVSLEADGKERAETLGLLGDIYRQQAQYEQARTYYEKELAFSRKIGSKLSEADSLLGLSRLYSDQQQAAKAQGYLVEALTITRQIKDKFNEGLALHQLMLVNKSLTQTSLAVFYGKQAVNIWQSLRSDIRSLEKEIQQSFLKSREDTYRTLADLLITQGRLPEAEQVIRLLKEEEYFEFIRRDATNASQQGQAQLTPEEQALDKRYHEIADQLAALGTERGALLDKPSRTPEEEQRLARIEADLTVAGQMFQKFLDGLANELGKNAEASNRVFQLRESQGMMDALRDLGKGTVALYTLVGEDQYRVILTTADVQKGFAYPIKAADLNRKILAFRDVLQNPKLDPLPLAQELYKILVVPLAKDLKAAKAETLMWSLDGVLRYVPIAALHDGDKYLVERWRNIVFTPASQTRLKDQVSRNWKALGLGVTKSFGERIPALPGVLEEMRGIIKADGATSGVLPGTIKLDEQFTQEAMLAGLRQRPPVVHVASHFQFKPGNETDSALLLGNGQFLSLAQIKSLPNVFSGVELLTLSACNTATSGSGATGKEVEGFGVLAQRQGAKAVIASLWPVADRSTKNLMQEFYKLREAKGNVTKAEAMRQAQIKLLRGELQVTGEALAARSIVHEEDKTTNKPFFKVDPKAPYAHPYYWAPFILIGNWK